MGGCLTRGAPVLIMDIDDPCLLDDLNCESGLDASAVLNLLVCELNIFSGLNLLFSYYDTASYEYILL